MTKSIEFDYNNQHYTLKYSKRTVKMLEAAGFDIDKAESTPLTSAETLFAGAFLACHEKEIRRNPELPGTIWKLIPDKTDFFRKLIDLYNEPLTMMFEEPEETDEKKLTWTANF